MSMNWANQEGLQSAQVFSFLPYPHSATPRGIDPEASKDVSLEGSRLCLPLKNKKKTKNLTETDSFNQNDQGMVGK